MHRARPIHALAVALVVLLAFNVGIARLASHSVARQLMRSMRSQPRLDYLFLGNSLMASGFDPKAFSEAPSSHGQPPVSFNAGLGSSGPVEHHLLAREAFRAHPEIGDVIYGFFDFQLTERPEIQWNAMIGNLAMAFYTEPTVAAAYYFPGSRTAAWGFWLIGGMPMLTERGTLWGKIEKLRRVLGELGLPKEESSHFGRLSDFAKIEAERAAEFERNCRAALDARMPLSAPVRDLLRLARSHKTRVFVVEMPMPSWHRNNQYQSEPWRQYRWYAQRLLAAEGATYINASDWIQSDNGFADVWHLNGEGARVFTARLAQWLNERQRGSGR